VADYRAVSEAVRIAEGKSELIRAVMVQRSTPDTDDVMHERKMEAAYLAIRRHECGRRQTRWCDANQRTACECLSVAVAVVEAIEAVTNG
jgi:hypothetical protein